VEVITWVHQTNLTESDEIIYNTQAKDKVLKELTSKSPRLFSGGANGLIIEWDTTKLKSKVCEKILFSFFSKYTCILIEFTIR
jgi:hypothetical protein